MSSTTSDITPIPVPSFEKTAIDVSFVEHISNSINDYYFPVNAEGTPTGEYFKNHVTDFGKDTRLYVNVAQTLWETSTDGVPEADHMASMALTTTKFVQNIDYITKKLSETLPSKLKPLNWRGKNLSVSFYNDKQFRGKDKTTGRALYGSPSCIFVLEMEPIPGMVAVCKPKRVFTQQDEEETEVQRPKPKATAPYRNAVVAPPVGGGGGGGGGGGAFRGKPKPGAK
jgi:hypothetical protein